MTKKYEVTADFVDKCSPWYLQDGHNRDGELLLYCSPNWGDAGAAVEDLMGSEHTWDGVPDGVGNEQIGAALDAELTRAHEADPTLFWPVNKKGNPMPEEHVDEEIGWVPPEEQPNIYVVLKWKEIEVVRHRVFVEIEVQCLDDQREDVEQCVADAIAGSTAIEAIRTSLEYSDACPETEVIGGEVLDNVDQRLEKYVDLVEQPDSLLSLARVSLWPNDAREIWVKSKDGRYGFAVSGGEGPAGFGLRVKPFSRGNVDIGGNHGPDWEVFHVGDVQPDVSITAYKSDERSQQFRKWVAKEGPHPDQITEEE